MYITRKSSSHDFHAISFSHGNFAKSEEKKTSHANIMQMCSHDIRLKIARFSCDLFYARFYAIRYLCQIHKIYAKFT